MVQVTPIFGGKYVAVFAFFVYIPGRNIRLKMALRTSIRLSGYLDGKAMPGMTRGARSATAIRVEPPNSLIWPVGEDRKLHVSYISGNGSHPLHLDFSSMTGVACFLFGGTGSFGASDFPILHLFKPYDGFHKGGIDRILSQSSYGLGFLAIHILVYFHRMAGLAVIR